MVISVGISDHSRAYFTGFTCSWGSRSTCMCSIRRQKEARKSGGSDSSAIHLTKKKRPHYKQQPICTPLLTLWRSLGCKSTANSIYQNTLYQNILSLATQLTLHFYNCVRDSSKIPDLYSYYSSVILPKYLFLAFTFSLIVFLTSNCNL